MVSLGSHCVAQITPSHLTKKSKISMARSGSRSRSRSRSPCSCLSRAPNPIPDSPHAVSNSGSRSSMQSRASTSSKNTKKSKITMNRSVSRSRSRSRSRSTTPMRNRDPSRKSEPDSPFSVSSRGSTSSMQSRASDSSLRSYGSVASSGACYSKDHRDETSKPRRSFGDKLTLAKDNASTSRTGRSLEQNKISTTEMKEPSSYRPRSRSRTARQPDIPFAELVQLSSSPSEASSSTREYRGTRPSSSRSTRSGRLSTRGRQLTREGSVPKLQTTDDSIRDRKIAPLRVVQRTDSKSSIKTEVSPNLDERVSVRRRGLQRSASSTSMGKKTTVPSVARKENSQQNPRNSLGRRLARYEDACVGRPDDSTVWVESSSVKTRSDHAKEAAGVGNVAAKVCSFSRCRSSGAIDDDILKSKSRGMSAGSNKSLVRNHSRQRSCSPGAKSVTAEKPMPRRGMTRSLSFSNRTETATKSSRSLLGGLATAKGKHSSSSSHGEYSSGFLGDYLRGKGPEKRETRSTGYVPKAFLVGTKDEEDEDDEPDFFD